jgi:drug/metabolite transporter (DMT)-like permease
MIYLVISILCSVTVGVLFKLAKKIQINLFQAITWNYFFALSVSYFAFKPDISSLHWQNIGAIHGLLGLLLPSIFVLLAWTIRLAGLARTDIAQRLSLLISICAAYFIFNETFDRYKTIGVLIGFLAIILILNKEKQQHTDTKSWLYLILVFCGYGLVDILFKKVSQQQFPYTTSLFIIYAIAFTLSICYLIFQNSHQKKGFDLKSLMAGCVLGLFNFGNILYYLKAHQALSNNPSTVFAAMNLGVISLGSVIGIVAFKEKFGRLNYVGLALALVAIVFITLSKIYAV